MITINDLIISYSKNKNVIDSLNLSIDNNTINGIVGLNGAGKTTLLNAIFGLIKIDSGTIHYEKKSITKKQMAYLVTENYFYSGITGKEYLDLFKNQDFRLTEWNELFNLPLDNLIDNYSTGMKKKLAFLGILKQNKPILILDEPFNGLDIETCRIIRSILLSIKNKGKTIIITSHIIETLTNLCDNIYYLENGKIKKTIEKKDFAEFETQLFDTISKRTDVQINKIIKNEHQDNRNK